MIIGNIITDKAVQDWAGYEKYDIVVANILHNVLEPLTPVIVHQLKPGGIYITSGIIAEKEEFVPNFVNPFRKSEQDFAPVQTKTPADKDN